MDISWMLAILVLVIVIASVGMVVWKTRQHQKLKLVEFSWILKADNNKAMAPLRVSACERLVIMLERIHPDSLVLRQNISTSAAALLQLEIIKSIREEFEHNVSLQIYVSAECWQSIRLAKDQVLEIVKTAYTKVKPESSGMELSREIFKISATVTNDSVRQAISNIRKELASY